MQEQITAFIKEHHLLTEHATILLGISGGPDSMALLHYFYSIRDAWDLNLIALSADHQLRGEGGKEDLEYVRQMCNQWGITFVGTSFDVNDYKQNEGVGTQIAARKLRYQFFAEQMKHHHADYLALGHHGDDQIETMLMALVRTASASSFSGIPVKRSFAGGYIIRPMLGVTKDKIEAYCKSYRITPRLDPSNKETTYTRNYFRKFIVPLLKEKNSNLHTTVQHLSETLYEDELFLKRETEKMVTEVVLFVENSRKVSLLTNRFKSYASALQRRAYHLILNYLYDELPKNLSYLHEKAFFNLLLSEGTKTIDFPRSLKIQKSYDKVTFFYQTEVQPIPFHEILDVPGSIGLPQGDRLSAKYTDKPYPESDHSILVPAKDISLPLHVRTRQPGDKMTWKGLNGTKKIKDVFIDQKVPLETRHVWPLVTDNHGTIIWLVGLRKKQFQQEGHHLWIQITYEKSSL